MDPRNKVTAMQRYRKKKTKVNIVWGEGDKLISRMSTLTEIRLIASPLADGISNDRLTRANCNKGKEH